jgi:outer membrane protein assembly factor BamD (BamD/ComL family)
MKTMKKLAGLGFMVMALVACALTAGALTSCASGPVEVPSGLTPAELIQRAQEASDLSRYDRARQYYDAILTRFPNDSENVCAAEYEIAFIHYKQKNYETAKSGFNKLLLRYNSPDAEALPSQYKVLAGRVLETIAKKEKK